MHKDVDSSFILVENPFFHVRQQALRYIHDPLVFSHNQHILEHGTW